jgi:hypothetical protein
MQWQYLQIASSLTQFRGIDVFIKNLHPGMLDYTGPAPHWVLNIGKPWHQRFLTAAGSWWTCEEWYAQGEKSLPVGMAVSERQFLSNSVGHTRLDLEDCRRRAFEMGSMPYRYISPPEKLFLFLELASWLVPGLLGDSEFRQYLVQSIIEMHIQHDEFRRWQRASIYPALPDDISSYVPVVPGAYASMELYFREVYSSVIGADISLVPIPFDSSIPIASIPFLFDSPHE